MFPDPANVAKEVAQSSPYFDYMSELDMKSRNHKGDRNSYIDAYGKAMQPFSMEEKQHLRALVRKADQLLKPYKNINRVPWRFVKLCCIMEGGFPHTQLGYIFLEQSFFLTHHWSDENQVTTLIHEKLHVFQRLFPLETNILIQRIWGYRACALHNSKPDARNNPDVNGIIFCQNGEPSYMAYNNDNPTNLNDSEIMGADKYEHPFERMAYELSEHISLSKSMKDTDGTLQWMRTYL